jgi:Tfp pilus assembly protein PilF
MKIVISILLAMTLWSTAPWAAASEDEASAAVQPAAWAPAMKAQDWTAAIPLLEAEIAADKGTANVHNLLGFAYRKTGNFDMAFKNYAVALQINPEHKGAHEYVGQTYLAVGKLEMAKKHLADLDRICFFGCSEYDDLKQAIAAYRPK